MVGTVIPLEIHNNSTERRLEITWGDGVTSVLPHRLLREACRCAGCVAAQRAGNPIAASQEIRLDFVGPYGANVLRLGFDDGHSRGLYPFTYLRELPAACDVVAPGQQENVLANPSSSSGLR